MIAGADPPSHLNDRWERVERAKYLKYTYVSGLEEGTKILYLSHRSFWAFKIIFHALISFSPINMI
jgi:hypothetical protein